MTTASDAVWYFQPLQIFTTLAAAVNFGGSTLQSPLVMPMLQMSEVPVHFAGQQTAYLLHESEKFFPPLNMFCTLGNLLLTSLAWYYSRPGSSASPAAQRLAAEKLPKLALCAALNIATTAWALGIMVPMNKKMASLAGEMVKQVKGGDTKSIKPVEVEFRSLQNRWRNLNYGRAVIMIGSSIAGMRALLV